MNYKTGLSLVDAVLFTSGKLAMAVAMVGSYPLLLFPSRICLHSLIVQVPRLMASTSHKWCKRDVVSIVPSCCAKCAPSPNAFFYGETLFICTVTYITAVLVPDIVTVFGLTGALTGNMIVFIMPALFAIQLLPGSACSCGKLPMWLLLLLGIVLMVLSTTFIVVGMVQAEVNPPGSSGASAINATLF